MIRQTILSSKTMLFIVLSGRDNNGPQNFHKYLYDGDLPLNEKLTPPEGFILEHIKIEEVPNPQFQGYTV